MHDEKLHWIRYGVYAELLALLYFIILYALRFAQVELGRFREYVLDSYTYATFIGVQLEMLLRPFTGKYIGLALGVAVNLLAYFILGALLGSLVWLVKRYRTDEDF